MWPGFPTPVRGLRTTGRPVLRRASRMTGGKPNVRIPRPGPPTAFGTGSTPTRQDGHDSRRIAGAKTTGVRHGGTKPDRRVAARSRQAALRALFAAVGPRPGIRPDRSGTTPGQVDIPTHSLSGRLRWCPQSAGDRDQACVRRRNVRVPGHRDATSAAGFHYDGQSVSGGVRASRFLMTMCGPIRGRRPRPVFPRGGGEA